MTNNPNTASDDAQLPTSEATVAEDSHTTPPEPAVAEPDTTDPEVARAADFSDGVDMGRVVTPDFLAGVDMGLVAPDARIVPAPVAPGVPRLLPGSVQKEELTVRRQVPPIVDLETRMKASAAWRDEVAPNSNPSGMDQFNKGILDRYKACVDQTKDSDFPLGSNDEFKTAIAKYLANANALFVTTGTLPFQAAGGGEINNPRSGAIRDAVARGADLDGLNGD